MVLAKFGNIELELGQQLFITFFLVGTGRIRGLKASKTLAAHHNPLR
jgi:hypothetical protein